MSRDRLLMAFLAGCAWATAVWWITALVRTP